MQARAQAAVARAEGEAAGMAKGEAKGEERYSRLVDLLLDAGRVDDIRAASADKSIRDGFYAEFGL